MQREPFGFNLFRSFANLSLICAFGLVGFGCSESPDLDSRANHGHARSFDHHTPSMSPDETAITYDSDESGNGDIYRLEISAERVMRLTTGPDVEMHPTFSPDGKSIAYARQSDGYQHVWIMKSDGSQQTQVTKGRVIDDPAFFSQDGGTLSFVRSSFFGRALLPKRELFKVSLDDTNHPVKRISGYTCMNLAFTMAISNAYYMDTQQDDLWLVMMSSGETRYLGPGSAPVFSQTGKQILYLTRKSDFRNEVVLKDIEDFAEAKAVPFPPGYKLEPAFCRRGEAVIVRIPTTKRDGVGGAYITDLRSSKTERIPQIPGGGLFTEGEKLKPR
jgi:dipeptidyl aminopeptidase/acylaminoacyl peptidase